MDPVAAALADPVAGDNTTVVQSTTTAESTFIAKSTVTADNPIAELIAPTEAVPSSAHSLADPAVMQNAAALVTSRFVTCDEYWETFLALNLVAVNAQTAVKDAKADKAAFTPNDVLLYLIYSEDRFGWSLKRKHDQDVVCPDPVLALFALVFAMGHALPQINLRLFRSWEDEDQEDSDPPVDEDEDDDEDEDTMLRRLRLDTLHHRMEFVSEGEPFYSLWDEASDCVEGFMSGSISGSSALQNLLEIDLHSNLDSDCA